MSAIKRGHVRVPHTDLFSFLLLCRRASGMPSAAASSLANAFEFRSQHGRKSLKWLFKSRESASLPMGSDV